MGRGVWTHGDDPTCPIGQSQESSGDISVPGSHPSGIGGVSWSPRGSEYPLTFGVSQEPLTLGCAAEWTLETPPGPAIVLTF